MNYLALIFSLFYMSFNGCFQIIPESVQNQEGPLLAVLIMVKNEALVIKDTLQPYLDAKIDHYLILDTGSTDGTVEVVREIFTEYKIQNGHIVEQPFVNFAVSRNYAIECAEQIFPHAIFFLMIDAEWYLQNVQSLIDFCKVFQYFPDTAFLVSLQNRNFQNYTCRLFKAHCGRRFEGVVHEYINFSATIRVPETVYFYWNPSEFGYEKSKNRWFRDRDLLLEELEKKPQDGRSMFYLAQTYDCINEHENAEKWYSQRAQQAGWDQEDFIVQYRLAGIYEKLGDWQKALFFYLKSYSMRSTRVEPLVCLAQHYKDVGDFATAFLFARQAVSLPMTKDVLFIEKIMYDYKRYDILGIVAWYVGEYEIGEKAVREALRYWPEATHLQNNLYLYEQRKLYA